MDEFESKPSMMQRLRSFIVECARVIRVTKKPSAQEYKTTLKVTAIGTAVIGLLGFLIQIVVQMIQYSFK